MSMSEDARRYAQETVRDRLSGIARLQLMLRDIHKQLIVRQVAHAAGLLREEFPQAYQVFFELHVGYEDPDTVEIKELQDQAGVTIEVQEDFGFKPRAVTEAQWALGQASEVGACFSRNGAPMEHVLWLADPLDGVNWPGLN